MSNTIDLRTVGELATLLTGLPAEQKLHLVAGGKIQVVAMVSVVGGALVVDCSPVKGPTMEETVAELNAGMVEGEPTS